MGFAFALQQSLAAGLYGIDVHSGDLYRVSTVNALLTLDGHTALQSVGDGPGALEFAPDGRLFAFTVGTLPELFQINPNTAAATLVGPLNIGWVYEGGLAFAPDGTAYGVNQLSPSGQSSLFTLNLATGQATIIGTISGPQHDINGLGWRSDGMLIGLDDSAAPSLLTIDPTTANSTVLAPLSPLSLSVVGGMTIEGDQGYFAAYPFNGYQSLYSFDAFTGNYSLVGSFPLMLAPGMGGLAMNPIPEPSTAVLGRIGLLVLLRLGRRAKP